MSVSIAQKWTDHLLSNCLEDSSAFSVWDEHFRSVSWRRRLDSLTVSKRATLMLSLCLAATLERLWSFPGRGSRYVAAQRLGWNTTVAETCRGILFKQRRNVGGFIKTWEDVVIERTPARGRRVCERMRSRAACSLWKCALLLVLLTERFTIL